jgi:hypothetical protein
MAVNRTAAQYGGHGSGTQSPGAHRGGLTLLRKLPPLVVTCALAAAAGCGGDADVKPPAKHAGTTGARGATDVQQFLLARGEEPGYEPSGPVTKVSNVEEFAANDARDPADARRRVRRLRDRGFVSFTVRHLEGKQGPGLTNVLLFTSAAGATRDAAQERRDLDVDYRGWTVKRFDISDVPGAFGWTATKPGEHPVGNVVWVEGRCVMTLGNAGEASFVAILTAGVHAVHRRVAGRCP